MTKREIDEAVAWWGDERRLYSVAQGGGVVVMIDRALTALRALKPDPEPPKKPTLAELEEHALKCSRLEIAGTVDRRLDRAIADTLHALRERGGRYLVTLSGPKYQNAADIFRDLGVEPAP